MTELKMEHVLMVLIVAFVLYYFMGSCSCGNGFSVGGNSENVVFSPCSEAEKTDFQNTCHPNKMDDPICWVSKRQHCPEWKYQNTHGGDRRTNCCTDLF